MSAQKTSTGVKRVFKHPKYVLKVKVEGPRVHRKGIAVPDLVRICGALQSAVHRQAEAMEKPSAPTLRRGPITATAQQECTLELVDLKGGSTDLVFRYAKSQQPLPIPEFATFGSDVLARIAETVKTFGGRKRAVAEVDAGVLDSLRELGEVLDKNSVTKISLTVPRQNGRPRAIKAVLNASVRERIAMRVKQPTQSQLTIEGKLEMADFKETGKLCRVHPPVGLPLQCSFDPRLEDQVYGALRRPVRVSGTARLNPLSGRPEELSIENIEIMDELLLGAKDFFASRTLAQLAEAQGVHALDKPDELTGGWPNDEDVDEFVSSIYLGRG
jgi:hypothetical protein